MNTQAQIRVLIVDHYEVTRLGLKQMLKNASDIKVVGEVTSGDEVAEFSKVMSPDVVVMSLNVMGVDFLNAIKKITSLKVGKILVVFIYNEDLYLPHLLHDGVFGFVARDVVTEEMIRAVRTVYVGQRYICPKLAQQVAFRQTINAANNFFQELSNREAQIALMITDGRRTSEIAQSLNVSIKTVNSYCYRIFKKLKIRGRVDLVRLAMSSINYFYDF